MAQRKRKRPPEHPALTAYRARSEERNSAARAALTPLAPGERPWPLAVAAAVALGLGLITLGFYLTGAKLSGGRPGTAEVIVYCGLMLACAVGCWRTRYWAVLGFQTLLAIGILGLSLALIRVTSLLWALACVAAIGGGGYLFWKLVRILGRMQTPAPPRR